MREVIASHASQPRRQVSPGPLWTLRVLVSAQAVGLVVAASFAGQGVKGGEALAETHVMVGMVVHLIALFQIVAAVLVWRPGRGAGWPAVASLGLFLVGLGQHFTSEVLGAHVPTGLTLFGLVVAVLIWAWSPIASRLK
ncbi:hypothetical protein [Sphaerisporangium fuscum]|uniref:hypothetical protein n=1 Tax=Sphaerisporangium fuscum TaxID=2835868 RepID=UPI001BDCFE5A|nr:hypothetical protein [Sphaerisporangium fuscum]